MLHPKVIANAGLQSTNVHGWAFGIGLERLAMALFDIPDIRLFWSEDSRFKAQFNAESFLKRDKFQAFSKYPPVKKDISAWIPEGFIDNDLFEIIREQGGDLVEKVELIEEFRHPRTMKVSRLFRVYWRSMTRNLTHKEINEVHDRVLKFVARDLNVELR